MTIGGGVSAAVRQRLVDERPGWEHVEDVLAGLARAKATFATETSASNRITAYEPGRRFLLETDSGASWVDVESIKECWETLERLGRISRDDVLEPGRRSALMVALFERVAGVLREPGEKTYLVVSGPGR